MPAKNSRPVLLSLFLIIVLVGIGIVAGFFIIRSAVVEQFGAPAPHLSLTQRFVYPIELFINHKALTSAKDQNASEQTFEISQGESVTMVCLRLEQIGIIEDSQLLRIYLVYTGLDRFLKAGQFKISGALSPVQIASELMDVTPKDAVVTILPGWRGEEVAANISGSGLQITQEEFINAVFKPSDELLALIPVDHPVSSLEGFLFPGMYVIPRETALNEVLTLILTEFSLNVNTALTEGFSRRGLSFYEALTLASIIEKEAVVNEEKPLIASVFYNRLAQGMRLETDPTVQYSLGYQTDPPTWWKSPLLLADLTIESPYNTYIIFGLPPTPISNPDLISLQAAAFPADTPYYFFRAACDGSGRHNFAITFEEHLKNACE